MVHGTAGVEGHPLGAGQACARPGCEQAPAAAHQAGQTMDMMMMQMWFEATTKVTLWFKAWHIQDPVW